MRNFKHTEHLRRPLTGLGACRSQLLMAHNIVTAEQRRLPTVPNLRGGRRSVGATFSWRGCNYHVRAEQGGGGRDAHNTQYTAWPVERAAKGSWRVATSSRGPGARGGCCSRMTCWPLKRCLRRVQRRGLFSPRSVRVTTIDDLHTSIIQVTLLAEHLLY